MFYRWRGRESERRNCVVKRERQLTEEEEGYGRMRRRWRNARRMSENIVRPPWSAFSKWSIYLKMIKKNQEKADVKRKVEER